MKFLAIDFGISTGYTYFENSSIVSTNSYTVVSDFSLIPIYVVNTLFDLIKEYKIDFYVVEDYSYGRKFFNTIQSEIIGAFKYKIYSYNMRDYTEYNIEHNTEHNIEHNTEKNIKFNTRNADRDMAVSIIGGVDDLQDIYFINPKTARKIVLGRGDVSKSEIKKYIIKNYGIKCKNQHEYDSILVGVGFLKLLENKDFSDAFMRRSLVCQRKIQ